MKSFLERLRSSLRSFLPLVLFCLVVSNFVLSCSAFRSARPQYRYHHVVVTNEVVQVVSNSVPSSVDSFSPRKEVERASDSLPEISRPYTFFYLSGEAFAKLDGFYYRSGDVLSSGRIVRIFPDRIYLHDGSTIVNSSLVPSRPQKENKHD